MDTGHELEIVRQLAEQSAKIEALRVSVDQLRKYFLYKFIATVVLVLLPLVGLVLSLPKILDTLSDQLTSSIAPLEQFRPPRR